MSVSGQDFGQAAPDKKSLRDFTEDDAVKSVAEGRLYSEQLEHAARLVQHMDNADVREAFEDVAVQLLCGDYRDPGGSGFAIRDALGNAVIDALGSDADMGRFSRLLHDSDRKIGADRALRNGIKALKAEVKTHHLEQGHKIHDAFNPETNLITFANGQTL